MEPINKIHIQRKRELLKVQSMKITYKGKPISCSYSNNGSQDTLRVAVSLNSCTQKNNLLRTYIKKKRN